MECTQCNCNLPDENINTCKYSLDNHRVCKKCYAEINNWIDSKSRTYKQFDEDAHKAYPKIFTDPLFFKKLNFY